MHDGEPSGVQERVSAGVQDCGEAFHREGAGAGVRGQGGGGVRACTAAKVHHSPGYSAQTGKLWRFSFLFPTTFIL